MKSVHKSGYVKGGQDGDDFAVSFGRYRSDLETLRNYITVCYHDLFSISKYVFKSNWEAYSQPSVSL